MVLRVPTSSTLLFVCLILFLIGKKSCVRQLTGQLNSLLEMTGSLLQEADSHRQIIFVLSFNILFCNIIVFELVVESCAGHTEQYLRGTNDKYYWGR
jgi:hypothetical protein